MARMAIATLARNTSMQQSACCSTVQSEQSSVLQGSAVCFFSPQKGRRDMAQTELHDVPGWSAEHAAQLAKSWINRAEQVVAVSVTSGGMASLAQQLQVSMEETQRLVNLARAALTPESRVEMGQRFDSDQRGMGVNSPGKDGNEKSSGKR
jgi:hypothetical protein